MKLIGKIIAQYVSKLIRAGKIEKALRVIQKFRFAPFESHLYQGICYFEMGDQSQALFHLKRAWDLQKNLETAQILAEIYMQQGRWDEARLILKPYAANSGVKQQLKIVEGDHQARQNYLIFQSLLREAMQCIQRREYVKSICNLEKAVPYCTDRAKLYNQIGGIYYNFLHARSKAEEYFRKAYESAPEDQVFKMNYAKAKLH